MTAISYDDFTKVDIRVGTVVSAEIPEWSHWVMKLTVDLGPEIGEKICFSGIMKFFKPEELMGNQYPFVVNMKPKSVGPDHEPSEVMMLMAVPSPKASDGGVVPGADLPAGKAGLPDEEAESIPTVLFNLPKKVKNGTKVL